MPLPLTDRQPPAPWQSYCDGFAAAARTAMKSVQGPVVELSEQKIRLVINNIEKSFYRIDKLLQPEWKD